VSRESAERARRRKAFRKAKYGETLQEVRERVLARPYLPVKKLETRIIHGQEVKVKVLYPAYTIYPNDQTKPWRQNLSRASISGGPGASTSTPQDRGDPFSSPASSSPGGLLRKAKGSAPPTPKGQSRGGREEKTLGSAVERSYSAAEHVHRPTEGTEEGNPAA
jgi:hypothetical protein